MKINTEELFYLVTKIIMSLTSTYLLTSTIFVVNYVLF